MSKISNTFINSPEVLDVFVPMFNLLEYSDNYSMTSEGLWNYYRDDINDDGNKNNAARIKINNKIKTGKFFEYKNREN